MLQKLTVIPLLFVTQIWALGCSTPTTISDLRFDVSDIEVSANEVGDAAVMWAAKDGNNEAKMIAYKFHERDAWSSPELVSDWGDPVGRHSCLVNKEGIFFGMWGPASDDDYNDLLQVVQKNLYKQEEIVPQKFEFRISDWGPYAYLDRFGNLTFAFQAKCKDKPLPQHYFSIYPTWDLSETEDDSIFSRDTYYSFAYLATKSPRRSQPYYDHIFLEKYRGIDRTFSEPVLFLNKKGSGYVIWKDLKKGILMSHEVQDGEFVGKIEPLIQSEYEHYFSSAVINEKGDFSVLYGELGWTHSKIVSKVNGAWSEPFLLAAREEQPWGIGIAMDEAGNIMGACIIGNDQSISLKVCYKPFGQPWMTPVFTDLDEVIFPIIKPDGKGNFVMIWEQGARRQETIMGASFSTETKTWSDFVQLSPTGAPCLSPSFIFWGPGKGYISWSTITNGFETSAQVAELYN